MQLLVLKKCLTLISKGVPVNLWITPKDSFGATVLHFPAGKGIIQIKRLAIEKGYKLNRYGLFKGDTKVAGENYDEILKILGTETKFTKIKLLEKVVESSEEPERFAREGQFPRDTEKYWRFRQIDPTKFDQDTFRTIKGSSGNARVIGKMSGKWKIQSILIAKSKLSDKDIKEYLALVIKGQLKEDDSYSIQTSGKYEKDLAKFKKSSRNWQRDSHSLDLILSVLKSGKMPQFNRPHKLEGWGPNIRDIHLGSAGSDWILILHVDKPNKVITLLRTGTHSHLYEEVEE